MGRLNRVPCLRERMSPIRGRGQMSRQTIYLLPDTNFFIECLDPKQIDWTEHPDLADFEEIHLLVSLPVHREIDHLKRRGNNRVGRRARKTSSWFRNLIRNQGGTGVVRASKPRVELNVGSNIRPSPNVEYKLDYSNVDEQIIGCLENYRSSNNGIDARLLTHDGGPMITSSSLGLPYVEIPEDWLRPPESNALEKENHRLRQKIQILEKAEPAFHVHLVGEQRDSITVRYPVYEPLSRNECEELTKQLESFFPISTNFDTMRRSIQTSNPTSWADLLPDPFYMPVTATDIDEYTSEYSNWLENCRRIISNIHYLLTALNTPTFEFEISNNGGRSARNVLLSFVGQGPIMVRPPLAIDPEPLSLLSSPPDPPKARSLADINARFSHYPLSFDDRRDPDEFNYTPGRSEIPKESFSLECERWRHATGKKSFEGNIFYDTRDGRLEGALECVLHAENMTSPTRKAFKLRFVVEKPSTLEHAKKLIAQLRDSARIPTEGER